ncbi:DUF6216 family protein [Pseudomonas sp. TCU-HL1]|uniref:DUF6216 family protein n=1 Tax=Pseudomonas sp. TCU-HL1 TaxID=1856685 RepID=UPI00085890F6|nr:DUF6216 family protein [Pseudomonas sp. TCU-HL1]AOE88111.1 hypothetical protein THL1_5564 [Pseudomonas sp. TCU-HL1]
MNTDAPFVSFTQIFDVIKWVVPFALLLFAFIFIRMRAGSAGFLLHRLWTLLGGKKDFENSFLQGESNRLDDFEKIKYVTGIRFKSLANVMATLDWLKDREIGLEELIRARTHFIPQDISIRLPNVGRWNAFSNVTMVMFVVSALLVLLVSFSPAWFFVKKTGSLFWVTEDSAGLLSSDWEFTHDNCAAKGGSWADQSIPENHDRGVVCKLLDSEDKNKIIKSAIHSQIGAAGIILLLCGYIMVAAARAYVSAKLAADLHNRVTQEASLAPEP